MHQPPATVRNSTGSFIPLSALVVGGGMITEEVILPTLFQQQRRGSIGKITVVSRRAATIKHLRQVFPRETFAGLPDPAEVDSDSSQGEGYKEAIKRLSKPAVVIVATPDHLHTPVILSAVEEGHHVIVEKPLCLKVQEVYQIMEAASRNSDYVLTDYHKRHDPGRAGPDAARPCLD